LPAVSDFLANAIVLLAGAVIAAPLFKRIGLGTVLGYLAAGIVIGPVLGFVRDAEDILQFSELGIVLLLFVIGLELKPSRLWAMRYDIFGLGSVQVVSCGLALAALAFLVVGKWPEAILIGFGLALSSTAFAMQVIGEAGDTNTVYGRKAFSILLLQDLAIVPLMAFAPLLAHMHTTSHRLTAVAYGVAAIAILLVAGRYLLNPLFGILAQTKAREVMIAAALLVVFGSAFMVEQAGLSPALGAFLAGMLLAESAFRHQLEADIEPFRGILLGLFFMAIGLSLDLEVLARNWLVIVLCVPVAMAVKAVLVYAACRLFSNGHETGVKVAAVLTQHGEFAFVLFSAALAMGLMDREIISTLIAIVILSMVLTPVAVRIGALIVARKGPETDELAEDFEGAGAQVMLIGFSRVGKVVAQALLAGGTEVTIIDHNAENIRNAARLGHRIYFGDGTRADVLRAAGIDKAEIVVICTGKPEQTSRIIELINREWPGKRLYVRAFDRLHVIDLLDRAVEYHVRETFESAIALGSRVLEGLGHPPDEVAEIIADVRRRDERRLMVQKAQGIQAGNDMLHVRPARHGPQSAEETDADRPA